METNKKQQQEGSNQHIIIDTINAFLEAKGEEKLDSISANTLISQIKENPNGQVYLDLDKKHCWVDVEEVQYKFTDEEKEDLERKKWLDDIYSQINRDVVRDFKKKHPEISHKDLVEVTKHLTHPLEYKEGTVEEQEKRFKMWREFRDAAEARRSKSNKDEFISNIEDTFETCLEIVKRKNKDYGETDKDPFRNFRNSDAVGVPPEKAILVRISDKLSRISTLLEQNAEVKEESIDDTIHDAINYFAILKNFLKNNKKYLRD